MVKRILLIEDDDQVAGAVESFIRDLGFEAERVADGSVGLAKALEGGFEMVILDIVLPGLEGVEVCRKLREQDSSTPVVMLTGKDDELSKVLLLELGADDYITKPFSASELKARMKAVLRRSARSRTLEKNQTENIYRFNDIEIDLARCVVRRSGKEVSLTASEFEILEILISRPGHPFSREYLISRLYGDPTTGYTQSIGSHISRMRAKLESDPGNPEFLLTARGFGYKVAEPNSK